MITGAEVATVAKAGASVAQGIKGALAQPEIKWPDAQEALMELFVILDDWCASAEESNKVAREALRARLRPLEPPQPPPPGTELAPQAAIMNTVKGQSAVFLTDIQGVIFTSPPVPWLKRWRSSTRRAAARRTIRSMLRIYCPDLLDSFEEAVTNRAAWMTEHQAGFVETLQDPQTPVEELQRTVSQAEDTLRDLRTVRDDLRRLIQENYPALSSDQHTP